MEQQHLPDMVKFVRKFSVMVRSQGPDPKSLKMRNHAFHLHQSGRTALSASGLLLPPGSLSDVATIFDRVSSATGFSGCLVITSASVVEPFLIAELRRNPSQELYPRLIPDASIDVLVEGDHLENGNRDCAKGQKWFPSQLLALVDVTASYHSLLSLVGADGGSQEHSLWEVGWYLGLPNHESQSKVENNNWSTIESYSKDVLNESSNFSHMAKSASRIAILGVPTLQQKNLMQIDVAQPQQIGGMVLVIGSPFGVLSPSHFFNSICLGTISNCCSAGSSKSALLIADIRPHPGMQGAIVVNRHGCLVGLLTSPLRQKNSNTEIQLVITWEAIRTALNNKYIKKHEDNLGLIMRSIDIEPSSAEGSYDDSQQASSATEGPAIPSILASSLQKAVSSVALIAIDGAWASGIVLNKRGLILTNAHLLEPWRFGRTSLVGQIDSASSLSAEYDVTSLKEDINSDEINSQKSYFLSMRRAENVKAIGQNASLLDQSFQRHKKISVRLDQGNSHVWYSASVVYISKGPLDVALLQLQSIPVQLFPIKPYWTSPSAGQTIYVIGHGFLGPRSGLGPSVSSGVVSNVLETSTPLDMDQSNSNDNVKSNAPIMLQTTAAVYPGASGGLVVNTDGQMIGLVTSNARHGSGSIIPHLNFSIPCAVLEPVFKFAEKQDTSVLNVLDKPNGFLSSVWALRPPPSASPESVTENHKKQAKGSRFAQFLIEKNAEPQKVLEQFIKSKLPSGM